MRAQAVLALALLAAAPSAARAQGVTLDHYRAAETPRDGFAIARPRALGHVGLAASLHLDYALEPLRGSASDTGAPLVDHQMTGQLGLAIGVLDRLVGAVRLPVVLLMEGTQGSDGDPRASGAGIGDLALSFRFLLVGDDDEPFALALQTEATVPLAEAASAAQDLAGEAGVSFTPELIAEGRIAPVRVTASVGARFREEAVYAALRVQHELTWGLAVGVDVVTDVLEAMLEAFGTTPLDRFGDALASPVELLLGVRVRPLAPLYVGVAGGLGLGDGYGAPVFRGVLMVGYADAEAARIPRAIDEAALEQELPASAEASAGASSVAAPVEPADAQGSDAEAEAGPRVEPPVRAEYGQLDRDGDHIVDAEDGCLLDREDFDEIADADGCPEDDADEDGIADGRDACPVTAGVESDEDSTRGCPARAFVSGAGAIVITERVEFATGSDRILPGSEPVLRDVLAIIQSSEGLRTVRIEGHTDDRGRDAANLRLSRARAASVRRWLVERGVDPARLSAWGCGELHPLAPNRTRTERQQNRRVEFLIVDPRPPELALRDRCEEEAP